MKNYYLDDTLDDEDNIFGDKVEIQSRNPYVFRVARRIEDGEEFEDHHCLR